MTQSNPNADPSTSHAHIYEVGWMFVREYYKYLNNEPGRLHCFYAKDSMSQHGYEGESIIAACSQQEIFRMFEKLKYQNCRVFISNVDSQPSRDGGVLVQVLGEMSNNGQPSQKFAQTFFLAKQPKGYYILNDILRFLDEEVESEVETTEETNMVAEKTNLMEDHTQQPQQQPQQQQQQQQQQRGSGMQTMETKREQVGHEKSKPTMRAKSPEHPLSVAQATVTTVGKEPVSPLRATSPKKTQKSKSRSPKRTDSSAPVFTESTLVEAPSASTATTAPPSMSAPVVPEKPKEVAAAPSKPASWAAMVQTAPSPSAAVASPAPSNAANATGTMSRAKSSSTVSRTTSPPLAATSGPTQHSTANPGPTTMQTSSSSGSGQHFHPQHSHHHHSQQQHHQQQRGGSHPRSQTGGSGNGNNSSGLGSHSRIDGGSYRSGNSGYRRDECDPNSSVYIRCYLDKEYSEKDVSEAFKDTTFKRIDVARQGAVCFLQTVQEARALVGKVSVKEGGQYVVKSHEDPNVPSAFVVEARKGMYLGMNRGSGGSGNKNNSGNNGSYQRSSRPPMSSSSHPLDRTPHPRGNNNSASSAGHSGRNNHRNNSSSSYHYEGSMASGMAMSGGGRSNN